MNRPLRHAVRVLACSVLLAGAHDAMSHWLVDASGGGDFTGLQEAIDAVAPGDVLLIAPGQYGDAVMDKRLRLLGRPPATSGAALPLIASLDVQGASSFTLAHLKVRRLRLDGVSNRSEIDRCEIGGGTHWSGTFTAFDVRGVGDLLVSRTDVIASAWGADGRNGMEVSADSTVQLVQCEVHGADAYYDSYVGLSGWGGHALILTGESRAWLVDTDVRGGFGQDLSFGSGCYYFGCDQDGRGGDALVAAQGSFADVRGTAATEVRGGLQNPTSSGPYDGYALRCQSPWAYFGLTSSGAAVWDGVALVGAVQPCAAASLEPMPRLDLSGSEGPGLPVAAQLFGKAGAIGVLVGGLKPMLLAVPWLASTPVFVDPGLLLVVLPAVLAGPGVATAFPFTQPPDVSLAGLRLHLQGVEVQPSGLLRGTNAQAVVLTW